VCVHVHTHGDRYIKMRTINLSVCLPIIKFDTWCAILYRSYIDIYSFCSLEHLADAFIQSDFNKYICRKRQQYIAASSVAFAKKSRLDANLKSRDSRRVTIG